MLLERLEVLTEGFGWALNIFQINTLSDIQTPSGRQREHEVAFKVSLTEPMFQESWNLIELVLTMDKKRLLDVDAGSLPEVPFSTRKTHDPEVEVGANFSELVATVEAQQSELHYLRQQLALREQALDSLSTHFVITRHEADDSYIEYCNRAMAESYGYTREELTGKSIKILLQDVWDTPAHQQTRNAIRAGEVVSYEREVTRRDGQTFWRGVTITPVSVDVQGRATCSVTMAADITARRESELREKVLQEQVLEQMKERERILLELRLAQKLESVGRLAAGIAHEINTPIQYIGDSVYFLRSAFEDIVNVLEAGSAAVDECQSEAAATIRQRILDAAKAVELEFLLDEMPKAFERTTEGIVRVTGIVRAMKEFSHPDAVEHSQADINHALQNTLIVASNEHKYVARISTALAEDLPPVTCNIGELNQVFLNLIVNAAHAIHDAGKDISSGEITITTAQVGECVEITIGDNGCGIPQENLDKIYDPFFTTKDVGRGTGQGLAITHSIVVDKHGGTVRANSKVGAGTQFTISLPIAGRSKEGVS